jgi:hypothetical protein
MTKADVTLAIISALATVFTIVIPGLFTYLGNRQANKLTGDKDKREFEASLEVRLLSRIKDLEDRLTAVETERYKLILENAMLLGKVDRLEADNKDMQTHIEVLELEIKQLRDKQA